MSKGGPDFAAAVQRMFADPDEVAAYARLNSEDLNRIEETLVRRAFASGQRILDVGCGAGREAVPMARRGLRVAAIDFVPAMVQATAAHVAAHSMPVACLVGSATALPFREGSFDGAALFNNVISHVATREQRIAALRGVWRVLRPGGTLAMITSNRRCHWKFRLYFSCVNPWRRLTRRLGHDSGLEDFDRWTVRITKGRWRQPAFFHMYDADEAVADLRAANFELVDTIVSPGFDVARNDSPILGFLAQHPVQ
jgi:ubiquinone/menaquinone biosynthesis C-methylase UbiE